jgi:hypothetical protein
MSRVLAVLLTALATACAAAAGFDEVPHGGQIIFLVLACVSAAVLQMDAFKKLWSFVSTPTWRRSVRAATSCLLYVRCPKPSADEGPPFR